MHSEDVVVRVSESGRRVFFYREPDRLSPLLENHPALHCTEQTFERKCTTDEAASSNTEELARVLQLLPPMHAVKSNEGESRCATAVFIGRVPSELFCYFSALRLFKFSIRCEALQFVSTSGHYVRVPNETLVHMEWVDPRFGPQAVNTSVYARDDSGTG